MQRIPVTMLAAGLCIAATGCIAVVKSEGPESKPKPVAATPLDGKGSVEPVAVFERKPEGDGHERVWVEVRYVNDSGRTLSMVSIWCRALDKDGYQVESQRLDLTAGSEGPLAPGFKAKRYVSFYQYVDVVKSVVCEVTSAQ